MASPSNAVTPPPQMDGADSPPPQTPSAPMAASPAPPSPSPEAQGATAQVIQIVSGLRSLAKSYPIIAPVVSEINDKMRELLAKLMQQQTPGEPQAPPNAG